jgi:GntR family transcriptional regulator
LKSETEPQPLLIDRNSQLPLHRQLRQILLSKIEGHEWLPGDIIPREIDLTEEYGLSRYTVRQALDDLVQAGYLIRTKKRGTVVSQPKVEQNLSQFYSFARDMAAKGLEPTSRILRLEEIIPDEETAQLFKLENTPQAIVYHLRRLRLANAEPLVIESSYLAFTTPVDLHEHDWRVMPLYNVLESYYGIKVERAEEFLEPVNLEAEAAHLLQAPLGLPAFRVERLTYDNTGRLFERRISLIRGDRYRFHVQLPKLELVN